MGQVDQWIRWVRWISGSGEPLLSHYGHRDVLNSRNLLRLFQHTVLYDDPKLRGHCMGDEKIPQNLSLFEDM